MMCSTDTGCHTGFIIRQVNHVNHNAYMGVGYDPLYEDIIDILLIYMYMYCNFVMWTTSST